MSKKHFSAQSFIALAQPSLARLYSLALLITDNASLAEAALQEALLDIFFAESAHDARLLPRQLQRAVRKQAWELWKREQHSEFDGGDWRGIPSAEIDDASLAPVHALLLQKDLPVQRYILLERGGIAGASAACALTGLSRQKAEEEQSLLARQTGGSEEEFGKAMTALCRLLLSQTTSAPDLSAVCRAFERDVESETCTNRRHGVGYYLFAVLGLAICMFLFWLMAVLLAPDSSDALSQAGRTAVCSLGQHFSRGMLG